MDDLELAPESETGPPVTDDGDAEAPAAPEPDGHVAPAAAELEVDPVDPAPPEQVYARATIHLPGLPLGFEVWVDPADPYIANCLRAGYLAPIAPAGSE